MTAAEATEHWATWTVDGRPFAIRYRTEVLREIAARAAEGFAKIPRGGLEVGGILFGHSEGPDRVTIEAWRPFDCEYKNGPYFELSTRDHADFERLLRSSSEDPDLTDLQPVGWWHSHTRTEIFLSEQDLALHDRYFRQSWQVAAVLKPSKLDPTRIGFFYREPDGSMHTASSYREFALPPRPKARERGAAVESAPEPLVTAPAEIKTGVADSRAVKVLPILPPEPSRRPLHRSAWVVAVLAVLLVAAAVSAFLYRPRPAPDVQLRIAGTGDMVTVQWDPSSWVVERSSSADLEIRDGTADPHAVHLNRGQLTSGRLIYVRSSPEVNARMRLYGWGDDKREFHAVFYGPAQTAKPEPEPEKITVAPPVEQPKPATTAPAPSATPVTERQRVRTFQSPKRTFTAARAPQLPAAGPPPVTIAATLDTPVSLPGTPVPVPPAEPARVVRRAPSVGRAIWTGELREGSVLTFDGGRPSFGTITGRMPSGPARFVVHPAELGAGSIIIYSADQKYRSREDSFESPSARNGWNLTTYKWDPKRAGMLAVADRPRLSVRSIGRKVSVIVLDWEELP